MSVLLRKFRDEPAVAIAVLVGLLTAGIAGVTAAASGAAVLVVVLAVLASLTTAISGGQAIRAQVTPVTKVDPEELYQVTNFFADSPPNPDDESELPDEDVPPPPPDTL